MSRAGRGEPPTWGTARSGLRDRPPQCPLEDHRQTSYWAIWECGGQCNVKPSGINTEQSI